MYQVLPIDLFGCFKWPFQGLSDLHLGDKKVTWKKLVQCIVFHSGHSFPVKWEFFTEQSIINGGESTALSSPKRWLSHSEG